MQCPNCANNIYWIKVILITRWSSIKCSKCTIELNRKLDTNFFLLCSFSIAVTIFIVEASLSMLLKVILISCLIVISTYIDSMIIKLYRSRKNKNSLLGYNIIDD